MKLLIIEDSPGMRTVVRRIMEPFCTQIEEADTLQLATELLAVFRPDIILMDLVLPDSSYTETLAAIPKVRSQACDPVMVVVSGKVDGDDLRQMAMDAGADIFATKQDDFHGHTGIVGVFVAAIKHHRECPRASSPAVDLLEKFVEAVQSKSFTYGDNQPTEPS